MISSPIARISVVAGPDGNLLSSVLKLKAERQHGPWHTAELRIRHDERRDVQDIQLCPPVVGYLSGTRLSVKEAALQPSIPTEDKATHPIRDGRSIQVQGNTCAGFVSSQ